MQIWPGAGTCPNAPAEAAASISASSSTISGELPPSSSDDALQVPAAELADRAACRGRPGEGDHRRRAGPRPAPADVGAAADDLQQALRQAGLLEQARHQHAAGDRGVRVRLEHHGVAERERRRDRAQREHDREVPRRDHADDADRHPMGDRGPIGDLRRQHERRAARSRARWPGGSGAPSWRSRRRPSAGSSRSRGPSSRVISSARDAPSRSAARRRMRARSGNAVAAHAGCAADAVAPARAIVSASATPALAITSPVAGWSTSICAGASVQP